MMKKYFIIVIVVLSITASAQAKDVKWSGVSVLTMISGQAPLIKDELSAIFTLTSLWFSQPDTFTFFGDAGISWSPIDWLWLSPQIGGARGWTGQEAFTTTLQVGTSFFDGQLKSFSMIQFLIMEKAAWDIYTFHSVDFSPLEWLSIGPHAESVDELAWFGPHIGFSAGPWHSEIRWQAGGQLDSKTLGHEVRFVTSLSF